MRRVHIRHGLKERIPEMLGTDEGSGTPPDITPWSIQAAMMENMRRIVRGIVGDIGIGRPMKGMWLTKGGSETEFFISPGTGFTANGDVIVIDVSITVILPAPVDGVTQYIYLKHFDAAVDGDLYSEGMKTGFIGREGLEDIVYDDFAASKHGTINEEENRNQIIVLSTTLKGIGDVGVGDLVYIGNVLGTEVGGA